ncbi:hypothetical protein AFB00_17540 [Pseudonocardia sp. HH130630-07]|nr:hypothetical protein AFB00_17540 [Pseudonocardia sp. HH130630-07]
MPLPQPLRSLTGPLPELAGTRIIVLAQAKSLDDVIGNLRDVITGLLAGLATLMLLVGGTLYLLAGGDPARIENAKSALKSAAAGYVLAVLAPVLLTVLQQVVG